MKKNRSCWVAALAITVVAGCFCCAQGEQPGKPYAAWHAKLRDTLPLLGHRNWILIVDSAYPQQNSPGMEAIDTGAQLPDVLREAIDDIEHSIRVRRVVYLDAELPFVPEQDAPGVSRYRSELKAILGTRPVSSLPHEQLLRKVNDVSRS